MNLFLYQLKQAFLSLKQNPGFVFSIVSTMGITLGALLCILTLTYVMLVKPLPYPEQDKLYVVEHNYITEENNIDFSAFPYPSLIHFYQKQNIFNQTAIIAYEENILTSLDNQPALHTGYVSPEWFSLLGATFTLGRGFEATEALNTDNPVAILSYNTWVNEFNQDMDILTKTVTFNDVHFRVIGVLNADFIEPQIHGLGLKTSVWLPWDFNSSKSMSTTWFSVGGNLALLGALKDNVSVMQAEQNLTLLINETWRENVSNIEFYNGWQIGVTTKSIQQIMTGSSKKHTYLLLVGVIGLVIIAFINIAALQPSNNY
ncbi:MAG: ABC-type antimicrobial peptide transport system permease subunit [Alteromonadaceae bacterium]|jgi:ABC-type antimicrobial peptide transport system permease subunit